MSGVDAKHLSRMLDLLYSASLDQARWPEFLASFATAVGSESAALFVHDFAQCRSSMANELALGAFINFDPAFMATFAHFSTVNPWTAREGNLAEGIAVTGCMLLPASELVRTEWFGDWLQPQGLFHSLGGVVLREENQAIKVTALRPHHRGDYTAAEMSVYELLVPHMHRAIAIHRRACEDNNLLQGAWAALDSLTTGVVLLRADASIAHCNATALKLIHRCGHVRICRRRLAFGEASLQRRYERTAAECIRLAKLDETSSLRSAYDMYFGPFGGVRFTIAPIRQEDAWQIGSDIRAAAFLTDESGPPLDALTIEVLYGLTRAEARLAASIASGYTLDAYASEKGITRNTVVSQLKSVLKKTDTRGQSEVIRLLLNGPAGAILPSK